MPFEACESAMLGFHDEPVYGKGVLFDRKAIVADEATKMESYDIRPRAPLLKTANFSGGNQQKIVLAREIERNPAVILVGQPTRGVDIGAIEFIHKRIVALRDAGKAVLAGFRRTGRNFRAVRPNPRALRGPHHRRAASRGDQRPGPRPADGGRQRARGMSKRRFPRGAGRFSPPRLLRGGVGGGALWRADRAFEVGGNRARPTPGPSPQGRGGESTMSTPLRPLPAWADVALIPLLNVGAAFFISGLVVLAIGENPLEAVKILIAGALGDLEGIGFTLYYATSFIFTGLAVAICFHAGLFNIGVEGQAYVAGLGAALAALYLGFLPGYSLVIVAIAAAALFGAAFAAIPGYLQAKRDSHIVITTIMFNYIASALMGYLLVDVLRVPSQMNAETRQFPPGGIVPQFHEILKPLGIVWPVTPFNLSFLLALAAALGVWVLIWRTRLGYEIRTVGVNPTAAVYGGISPARITIITTLLSGALAGGLAVNVILGEEHRLILEFTAGFGFVGIAVALMGRAHPVGIILAAILFGVLYQGGAELAFDKPKISRDMIIVIQGLVVLFAGALEHMFRRPVAVLLARRTTQPPI